METRNRDEKWREETRTANGDEIRRLVMARRSGNDDWQGKLASRTGEKKGLLEIVTRKDDEKE